MIEKSAPRVNLLAEKARNPVFSRMKALHEDCDIAVSRSNMHGML